MKSLFQLSQVIHLVVCENNSEVTDKNSDDVIFIYNNFSCKYGTHQVDTKNIFMMKKVYCIKDFTEQCAQYDVSKGKCTECVKGYDLYTVKNHRKGCIGQVSAWVVKVIISVVATLLVFFSVCLIFGCKEHLRLCCSKIVKCLCCCCKKNRDHNRQTAVDLQENYILHENIDQINTAQPQIQSANQLSMNQQQFQGVDPNLASYNTNQLNAMNQTPLYLNNQNNANNLPMMPYQPNPNRYLI